MYDRKRDYYWIYDIDAVATEIKATVPRDTNKITNTASLADVTKIGGKLGKRIQHGAKIEIRNVFHSYKG
jgi:hypothetical protein